MQYIYKGFHTNGKKASGKIDAVNQNTVKQVLQRQGITAYEIYEKGSKKATKFSLPAFNISLSSISIRHWVGFLKKFSMLLRGGAIVHIALDICVKTTSHKQLRNILKDISENVKQGQSLHLAFAQHKQTPNILPAMIKSGEEVGNLTGTLENFYEYWQRIQALKSKLFSALLYPAILMVVSIIVLGVLMGYIVPKVISQVSSYGAELPYITRVVITIQEALNNYWGIIFGILLSAIIVFYLLLRRKGFKFAWHKFTLKVPVIGYILNKSYNIMFARTLSILLGGNIPLDKALGILQPTINNMFLRQQFKQLKNDVSEGISISQAIKKMQGINELLKQMIVVGEQNAALPQSLQQASNSLELELETFLNRLVVFLEPMIILIMGILVFAVILAVLLPILQLNTFVGIM